MASQGNIKNNKPVGHSASSDSKLKAKIIFKKMETQTKIDAYNPQTVEDSFIPSVQSTQLHKQTDIASVTYCNRLFNIMKQNGIICQPVRNGDQIDLHVEDSGSKVIMCTGIPQEDNSSGTCQCNKYFIPEYDILGSTCHFCYHSILMHRVKPELEEILYDDTKNESQRNEYKYWFDKFIELQRMYCYTDKNLPFDDKIFISIYDKPRQARLSFIQSPNYRYVLIKYQYGAVYDEGEHAFSTTYRIISLQTMLPVETDEKLYHSWSYYRYSDQSESGYRTIEWDLTKPATLIATSVKYFDEVNDVSKPCYIDKIVYIEYPHTD